MRILVVEDEVEMAAALRDALVGEAFAVDIAATLDVARFNADLHEYDAVILDRRLPDGDGADLCREWRDGGKKTPVLMLTALDDTSDIVEGLEGGADDYVTKPFALEVLLARVRSVIRRGPRERDSVIKAGMLEIDPARRRVVQKGVAVPLTTKEFSLLNYLGDRAGEVVDRLDILEHCWDHAYEPGSNVIDVHVGALRRKLGDEVIETVRGAGYRLVDDEAGDASTEVPLGLPTAPDGTVTLLFTDIKDSTAINERLGDKAWDELLSAHDELVRVQIAAFGGYEVKTVGDGFMVAFPSARRALACAIEIQRAMAAANEQRDEGEQLQLRLGLHTGEAVLKADDFFGRHVNLAARIAGRAEGEQILVSSLLHELTQSTGEFAFGAHRDLKLKGLEGRHRVHSVDWTA